MVADALSETLTWKLPLKPQTAASREVEGTLASHPAVKLAVVTVYEVGLHCRCSWSHKPSFRTESSHVMACAAKLGFLFIDSFS